MLVNSFSHIITNSRPCHEIDCADDLFKLTQPALFLINDDSDQVMVENNEDEDFDVEMVPEESKSKQSSRSDSKGSSFNDQKQVREIEYK